MSSSIYEIAKRISAGNASNNDQLEFYELGRSFIFSKHLKIQILNHFRIKYPNKDEGELEKDEFNDLAGDAYRIALEVLPDAIEASGKHPGTVRDNILCGYIKTSVQNEILKILNKDDPEFILYIAMKACLSELEANELLGIKTCNKEGEKHYYKPPNSEFKENFYKLAWKDKISSIRFPFCKGTKRVKNPTPGQIIELVPMVLDGIKQPLNRSQLTEVLACGFELNKPKAVSLIGNDDNQNDEELNFDKDLNQVAIDKELESFDDYSSGKAQKFVAESSKLLISIVEHKDENQKIGNLPMEGGKIGNVLADYFIWAYLPTKDGKKYSFEKYYKLFKIDKEIAAVRHGKLKLIVKDIFSESKNIQDPDLRPIERNYDHSSYGFTMFGDMLIELRKRFSLRKPKFIEDPYS